jgi:hypothetical protein
MGKKPTLDGSHDNIDYNVEHPKTVQWMVDILGPLFEECTEEERQEFMLEMAELLEDDLKIHDPDSPLLEMLNEKRHREDGFN